LNTSTLDPVEGRLGPLNLAALLETFVQHLAPGPRTITSCYHVQVGPQLPHILLCGVLAILLVYSKSPGSSCQRRTPYLKLFLSESTHVPMWAMGGQIHLDAPIRSVYASPSCMCLLQIQTASITLILPGLFCPSEGFQDYWGYMSTSASPRSYSCSKPGYIVPPCPHSDSHAHSLQDSTHLLHISDGAWSFTNRKIPGYKYFPTMHHLEPN